LRIFTARLAQKLLHAREILAIYESQWYAFYCMCAKRVLCQWLTAYLQPHSMPSFFLVSNNYTFADGRSHEWWVLFPLCRWSILISRLVSRKLNHCAIDENDGSLCRKCMRCKIFATHSLANRDGLTIF